MKKNGRLLIRLYIFVMISIVISSGVFAFFSFIQARSALIDSTRQRMLDIANCAAGGIDGDVLKTLTAEDEDTPEYKKIYDALAVYRDNVELEYVYGIKDEGGGVFTFTVDPALEDPAVFGDELEYTDALAAAGQGTAAVDEQPYTDAWGTFYSAYSPVFDSDGNVAGIVGADFSVEWFERQQREGVRNILKIYLVILVVTLIVAGAFCTIWIRNITKPINWMINVARKYEVGDFSQDPEVERQDEIGALSRSLKSMAVALKERADEAESANRAKDEFLANMSHELRTPINAILGMNEMIARGTKDDGVLLCSENIKASGNLLLGFVDQLLAFKQPEMRAKDSVMNAENGFDTGNTASDLVGRFTAPSAAVLVVDDNPMNLAVLKGLLERTGVMLNTADSGDEGIRISRDMKYDLIFMDHMMPEKDGIETLHEIRQDPGNVNLNTPVVCLTANAIAGARDKYLAAGFDDYMTKPVDDVKLEETLLRYIPKEKIIETVMDSGENAHSAMPVMLDELVTIKEKGLAVDAGIKNSGSVEAYIALLEMFRDSADDRCEEICGYYDNQDIKNYTIKVHAIKSSGRLIGADDFADSAQLIEDAGKRDDTDYIKKHHGELMEKCMQIRNILSEIFPEDIPLDVGERQIADSERMKKVYEELHEAAEEIDSDRIDAILDEMSAYIIPEIDADRFSRIRDAAKIFDYDTVEALSDIS